MYLPVLPAGHLDREAPGGLLREGHQAGEGPRGRGRLQARHREVAEPQVPPSSLDRDNMAQDAQINWNQLDSFILGQFLKKKCLVF